MTAWEKAMARSKLEYLEKYKTGKAEDVNFISNWLGYKTDFIEGRTKAVIHMPDKNLEVTIRAEQQRY